MTHRPTGVVQLPLSAVEANPFNVRDELGPNALKGLAESIRQRGLIHPILVRPHPDRERFGQYQIVCGERRFRAHELLAGEPGGEPFAEIQARVEELNDTDALAAILQENELRADWNPYEKAAFFRAIYEEAHFPSIRRMAADLGIGLTTLHRYLRVFDLPAPIVERFRRGELGLGHVEVVLEAPAAIREELAALLAERYTGKAEARRLARQLAGDAGADWVDGAMAKLGGATTGVRARPAGESGLAVEIEAGSPQELQQRLKHLLAASKKL